MATKTEKPKIMVQNISCILPETDALGGLFLGNGFGAENSDILKQYGIRAVLTTSIQTPVNYDPVAIPFHLKIQAHDKETYSIIQHLEECMDFINKYRQLTNVYVHCYAGVSRSATIIIAYLMKYSKWNLKTALQFVQAKRVVAKPNDGFMQQLKKYQQTLFTSTRPTLLTQNLPNHNPASSSSNPAQSSHPIRHHSAFQPFSKPPTTHPSHVAHTQTQMPTAPTPIKRIEPSINPLVKRHSQTPIPRILSNKPSERKEDVRSPMGIGMVSLNKGNSNSQIKYYGYGTGQQTQGQAQQTYNGIMNGNNTTSQVVNGNSSNMIQNVKSAKNLIRPKDLPGYKH